MILKMLIRLRLGLKGSPTIVGKMFTPPRPEGGKKIEGTPDEQVKQLMDSLNGEKGFINVTVIKQ